MNADEQRESSFVGIIPAVKEYAWGIRGPDSRVARFAVEAGAIEEIDPGTPYAELWIGTHSSGRSMLKDGRSLEDALGGPLPFIFKILSAGKALSIQAHPDKNFASRLHEKNPENYKDSNYKPEMAIALTPFEAMCGFRRIEEIAVFLRKHREFADCVSTEAKLAIFMAQDEESKQLALKDLFSSFMHCDNKRSVKRLEQLLIRLRQEQSGASAAAVHAEPPWERKAARAILRLAQQFPGDPGAMAPLFLNYLLIAPGESFFMAANEPHAYVAGEIIECMACSDNVVRAGLTLKYKDVESLVSMLTYSMGGPSIDAGLQYLGDNTLRYTPPVPEFEVIMVTVEPGETEQVPLPDHIPAIFIALEGTGFAFSNMPCLQRSDSGGASLLFEDGVELKQGRCFMAPCRVPSITLSVDSKQRGPLKVAIAHENQHYEQPERFISRALSS
uniref:mannose-6-phosphate isomerase n=1 Tax=Octactis speculum TaxID=3111310 RepID=A0A7S2AS87_9STRA|mmetsp:Transcript_14875/g.19887  ORF Transcript_14875/g.19887 Transcript_14875/m.19887 type:complete len:445 (+) Transcript_14875:2-1336(+)